MEGAFGLGSLHISHRAVDLRLRNVQTLHCQLGVDEEEGGGGRKEEDVGEEEEKEEEDEEGEDKVAFILEMKMGSDAVVSV